MMKDLDYRKAFGETPAEIGICIQNALARAEMKPSTRHVSTVRIVLLTGLAAILFSTAALLAVQSGVSSLFFHFEETRNPAVSDGVQEISAVYEGKAIRLSMQDAIVDAPGGSFAMSWTIENLHGEEGLYVLCEQILIDGKQAHTRSLDHATEFILPEGVTEAGALGELPGNSATEAALHMTVLRALLPIAQTEEAGSDHAAIWDAGKIPMDPMGYIPVEADRTLSYREQLLSTGAFEIADQFVLQFALDDKLLQEQVRHYTGETAFLFDQYELHIQEATLTATTAYLELEYLVNMESYGESAVPRVTISVPDMEIWNGNAGSEWKNPVFLGDGRVSHTFCFKAVDLFTQPELLQVTIGGETVELFFE